MAATTYDQASQTMSICSHCYSPVEHASRFCGECGAPRSKIVPNQGTFANSFQRTTAAVLPGHLMYDTVQNSQPQVAVAAGAPVFAAQAAAPLKQIPPELTEELGQLIVLLARERLFLIFHWCVFLTLNLTGFTLAMKAYNGFIGDEMTRSVIAMTPLFFINTLALACLSPIKGTKKEIARVKERITYVRFQIEYYNLF